MSNIINLPIPRILNEKAPAENLDANEMQLSTNCESRVRGYMSRRYGLDISYISDGWTALLADGAVTGTIGDFYIWASPVLPEGIYDEEVVVVYSSAKKLYALWRTASDAWFSEEVVIDGVSFSSPVFEFRPGRSCLLITDNENYPFKLWFDADKELQASILRILHPDEKPVLRGYGDTFDSTYFEEINTDDRLGDCSLVQMCFTVIDKDGAEGNPGPRSDTLVMQVFAKDADSGEDARWLDKVVADNLKLPAGMGDETVARMKYFGIYISMAKFSNGESYAPLLYSVRVPIYAKYDNLGVPIANQYVLTQATDGSVQVSYAKVGAPIAAHICENAGIIQLGNIRSRINFLWNTFKYYHMIEINNPNLNTMVDANIVLKLDEADIDNFVVSDFVESSDGGGGGGPAMGNHAHIRIFDGDLMTPLPVNVLRIDLDNNFMTVELSIPQFTAKQQHYVYLLWNPEGIAGTGTYTGAPAAYQTFSYGKFFQIGFDDWAEQCVKSRVNRVMHPDHVICTSEEVALQKAFSDDESVSITVPNLANTNNCGASEEDSSANSSVFIEMGAGSGFVKLYNQEHNNNAVSFVERENWVEIDNVAHENGQFSMWGFCRFERWDVAIQAYYNQFFSCGQSGDTWDFFGLLTKATSGSTNMCLWDSNSLNILFGRERINHLFNDWFLFISVDMDVGKSFILIEETRLGTILYAKEITGLDFSAISSIEKITIGGEYYLSDSNILESQNEYYSAQFNVIKNMYESDVSKVRALRMFMPYFETEMVGIKWWDTEDVLPGGDFSDPDDWNCGDGWSIVGGAAKCDGTQITVSDLAHRDFHLRRNEMTMLVIDITQVTSGCIYVNYNASGGTGDHPRCLNSVAIHEIGVFSDSDIVVYLRASSDFEGEIGSIAAYRPRYNNNISFDETRELEWKEYPARVVYTKPKGMNVPASYFRDFKERVDALIPVRGGNQEQDRAVTVVLTRNRFSTFILEGSSDDWATSPSAVIEAGQNEGLLQERAWCEMDGVLYWLSEGGLKRSRDGRTVERLSEDAEGYDQVDFGMDKSSTYRLYPCPVRKQILIVKEEG